MSTLTEAAQGGSASQPCHSIAHRALQSRVVLRSVHDLGGLSGLCTDGGSIHCITVMRSKPDKPVLRLLLRRFEGQHSFHNFTVELEQGSDKAKGTIFSFKCVPSQVCRPVDSKPSAIADRSIDRVVSSPLPLRSA